MATTKHDYSRRVPYPGDASINSGLTNGRPGTLLEILGKPRAYLGDDCMEPTNPKIKALIVRRNVGPFVVRGLKPAVDDLEAILKEVKAANPVLYAQLGTAGMLCCRRVRGSKRRTPSSHAFGTAVDFTIDGKLDGVGDGMVQEGLLALYPFFHKHKWYWGAEFPREDAMHFEASDELIREWHRKGLLG